jgi:folate-binding protein YgfZ
MNGRDVLMAMHRGHGGVVAVAGGVEVVQHYGDWRAEYRTAIDRVALLDRSWRGLIEVTGKDRAAWLHNLVTNEIRNLRPGDGNYAFAVNVQGRVLFDLNALVVEDRIWLDVDLRYHDKLLTHFRRYIIMEDVKLTDRSDEFARPAVFGPAMKDVASTVGPANAAAMAQLQHVNVEIAGAACRAVRNDFDGLPGVEYVVPADAAAEVWRAMAAAVGSSGGGAVGLIAARALRMEAGIPALGREIDEDVVAPETLQVERGISYQKGCYLGQEIIERMRSRGALSKRLVALRLAGEPPPELPAKLLHDGSEAGRLMSACESPALGGALGMGYVKAAHADSGAKLRIGAGPAAEVIDWPRSRPG